MAKQPKMRTFYIERKAGTIDTVRFDMFHITTNNPDEIKKIEQSIEHGRKIKEWTLKTPFPRGLMFKLWKEQNKVYIPFEGESGFEGLINSLRVSEETALPDAEYMSLIVKTLPYNKMLAYLETIGMDKGLRTAQSKAVMLPKMQNLLLKGSLTRKNLDDMYKLIKR